MRIIKSKHTNEDLKLLFCHWLDTGPVSLIKSLWHTFTLYPLLNKYYLEFTLYVIVHMKNKYLKELKKEESQKGN